MFWKEWMLMLRPWEEESFRQAHGELGKTGTSNKRLGMFLSAKDMPRRVSTGALAMEIEMKK